MSDYRTDKNADLHKNKQPIEAAYDFQITHYFNYYLVHIILSY